MLAEAILPFNILVLGGPVFFVGQINARSLTALHLDQSLFNDSFMDSCLGAVANLIFYQNLALLLPPPLTH